MYRDTLCHSFQLPGLRSPKVERHLDEASYTSLVKSATKLLAPYFIGFVNLQLTNGEADASIGGSGTLVSIGKIKGVLTAGHVIRSIMRHEVMGIVLPSGTHQRITFRTAYCRQIELLGKEESKGPDLGFLVLPPDTAGTLQSIMSFYNMSLRADRMLTEPPPLSHGFWGITGFAFAEELTATNETPPKGYSRAKIFKGGFGVGEVSGEEERDGFDYVKYKALYNQYYEGPDSFAGYSGGGLWQILVNLKMESPEIREPLLAGIAFYETEKRKGPEGLVRHIICHGKRSVYQLMLERIAALSS
jgi:hypothetical protein